MNPTIKYPCGCTITMCEQHLGVEVEDQKEVEIKEAVQVASVLDALIPERCVEMVSKDGYATFQQCNRSRGNGRDGLYCKQHAKQHPVL